MPQFTEYWRKKSDEERFFLGIEALISMIQIKFPPFSTKSVHPSVNLPLQAWFEKVQVGAMTVEETVDVLMGVREEYEWHYRLVINDEALKAAAELASRYISDLSLPGKAIALLDEAASQVSVQYSLVPYILKEAMQALALVLSAKENAIQQQEYELVAELRDREVKLRDRITKLESGWHRERGGEKPIVDEETVAQIVSAGL